MNQADGTHPRPMNPQDQQWCVCPAVCSTLQCLWRVAAGGGRARKGVQALCAASNPHPCACKYRLEDALKSYIIDLGQRMKEIKEGLDEVGGWVGVSGWPGAAEVDALGIAPWCVPS